MYIGNILEPFRSCPDTESEQSLIRVVLVSTICAYAFSIGGFDRSPQYLLLCLALFNSVFIIGWIACDPDRSLLRRVYSITTDSGSISILMYVGEQSTIFFFAMYIWIIIGYGFRYGVGYLYLSLCVSILLFSLVIVNSEYWGGSALSFSFGILFSLVIIPIYATKLIGNLRAAMERADTANRAKTQFLANMSHEMRTPLTGIVGFVDLMRKETLNRKLEKYLDHIEHSARNLRGIVNDVLDMSKAEAGELDLEESPVDLKKEIEAATASLYSLAKEKDLKLVVEMKPGLPDFVECDRSRLNQIVSNLVGNAIKFTTLGEVRFTAEKIGTEGNTDLIRLVIEDTGIGISQNKMNFIFEPFRQVQTGINRRYAGTGLGLSITKNIVDRMKGKISIYSEPGQYTRVVVDLPLSTIDTYADDQRKLSGKRLAFEVKNLKALVVDDNDVNQEFMRELLNSHGFCTDVTGSGKDALRLCRDNVYNVVFMDIHMADMDGIETTRRLIDMNLSQRPAVIAVTADVFGEKDGKLPSSCFDAVLTKPVEAESLLNAIETLFPNNFNSDPNQKQIFSSSCKQAVLNSERGIMLASDNKELWHGSVMKLLDSHAELMRTIRDAAENGHYKIIQQIAHRISGSASYVGAEALAYCARELEEFVLNNPDVDCQQGIDCLDQEFARLSTTFLSD